MNHRYLVPFYFRVIKVCDNICLILLSQLPRSYLSFHIHSLLTIINSLQYRPKELRCFHTLEEMDISIRILKQLLKYKSQRHCDDTKLLMIKFDQINSSEIRKYILSLNEKELSTQLDALCSSLCSSLRSVYSNKVYQYFVHNLAVLSNSTAVQKLLNEIKSSTNHSTRDYLDYFLVKSQRNVCIESYYDIFPGLISFIFINRSVNQMIIAKNEHLDETLGNNSISYLTISLNLLPQLIECAYTRLTSGKLSSSWIENELSMNYIMWFEGSGVSSSD